MEGLENLKQLEGQLKDVISQYGGISKLAAHTQDILPKDQFNAEIDGISVEVSSGISGRAITFLFQNPKDQEKVFAELKENKMGFFKKIFRK